MTATTERFGSIGGFTSLLDDTHVFESMREKDYPQFVTKTIRLLGSNSGLNLRFAKSAEGSHFNPVTKIVTIPAPPAFPSKTKGMEMEKFKVDLARWRGIVNHEVGHAQYTLWHTDEDRKAKKINVAKKTYPSSHHMFNDLFENGRMERVACKDYPGMMRDLQKLESFLGEIIKKMHDERPESFNHIYYALRMVVNGYEPVMPIPKDLKEDWDVVREMAKEAWETDDEQETYVIAQKVGDYLKKRHEEMAKAAEEAMTEEEKLEQELEQLQNLEDALDAGADVELTPASGDDDSDGIEMEMEGAGGSEGDPQEGEEGESSEGKGSASSDDKSSDEEGEESGSEGESSDKDSDGDKEGSDSKDSDGEEKEGESEGESSDKTKEMKKEIEEKKKELAEKLKEKMEEAKKKMQKSKVYDLTDTRPVDVTEEYEGEHAEDRSFHRWGGSVIPLPMHDYVKNVEVEAPKHSTKTKKILDEYISAVSGMAQRFIQKVRSRVHVGTRTYKGRVNRRKLHRYKYDKNIFKTQSLRKKKDAAVMIIVDCSGSMSGEKINMARKAALVIGEMMDKGKVEFEVRGFTIPYNIEYSFPCFTRQADLIHYRFGGSKDWAHSKHNVIDGRLEYGLQDNDDGESLRTFADELSQSKKETKMMVVISDGEPASRAQLGNGDEDLKKAIPEIRDMGIDVYAIGLSTNVEQYYGKENSVRLNSRSTTTELVEALNSFIGIISTRG
jgi:cobaltochelatase CobT